MEWEKRLREELNAYTVSELRNRAKDHGLVIRANATKALIINELFSYYSLMRL